MLIDTSVDGHVHTRLCHHARGAMEDYVQSAVARGLARIIFLEHLEEGISYFETTWLTDRDFDDYFREGERLQKKYRNRIEIGLGVEVGYNPCCSKKILARLSRHTWDRIGISYHFYAHQGRYLNLVSRQEINIKALQAAGPETVISDYLRTLGQAVLELPGTVLCHFDAMLRYLPNIFFTDEHHTLISELLDAVAAKKMAVEVNTSGYAIRNEPFPSVALLREVVKRSIPLTAGSDAHRPEDVGRYFDELKLLGQSLAS